MSKSKFTRQQLNDWERYEQVRQNGRHNMLFPQARLETRLSRERYGFALNNYAELRDAVACYRTRVLR